jgi:hypothetical protein
MKRGGSNHPVGSSAAPTGAGGGSNPPACKFTFLMPVYADTIGGFMEISRALKSVFLQTDESWQIIMASDGPNALLRDVWLEALEELKDKKKVVYFEVPYRGIRGGHHAVESAKGLATGEFLTILNGDNILRPTYIEDMYDSGYDILTCMVKMNDMPGIVTSGTGFHRGGIDRLNYSIRTAIAKRVQHKLHLDADYDWLIECWSFRNAMAPVRVKHVEKILAEHN